MTPLGTPALLLAVRARHGAQHLHELLAWLRRNPSAPVAVAAGCADAARLAAWLGARALPCPGHEAAWDAARTGRAEAALLRPLALAGMVVSGEARALATTAAQRMPVLSAVETLRENGLDARAQTLALWAATGKREALAGFCLPRLAAAWEDIAAALRAALIEPVRALG